MDSALTFPKKNLFLQRETLLIVGAFLVLFIGTVFIFTALWSNFRIGFVWIVAFLLVFASRWSESWKIGMEAFYLLTFLFSYIFGLWFALPLVYLAFALVVKAKPHELNGVMAHTVAITLVAVFARFFFNSYGLSLTSAEFIFIALASIVPGIAFDFFLAWKIAPVPLFKNLLNHAMDFTVNYFVITTIGITIYRFFLTLA